MGATAVEPRTVAREATVPTTTDKAAAPDDLWGKDWANESQPSGRPGNGNGRGRAELPALRTLAERRRKPSGKSSHPVLLITGENHSGKSFEAARLTGDERIGRSYWLQVGRETTADEYGAVDGARYEIIGHDGSWRDMYAALEQSHGEAHQLVKADDYDGRPPLLVVDSMTGVWEHLSRWAESRALLANSNVVKLLQDPHADIDIGALLWNAANRRHKAWMTLCLTWPGPVVLLARGKMSMAVNERTGNLDHKAPKVYTVNAQKDLPFEVTMHLRLDVKEHPEILGYRHPKHGIGGKAGGKSVVVDPRTERFQGVQFSLAWTLFNALRYDPSTAVVRTVNDPDPVTDTDVQNLPAARRLTPEEAAKLAGADEAPGQEPAAETEPRATR